MQTKSSKTLSIFSLVMINVIAVDSLRTLPISGQYGLSVIFYYILAAICFFIPSALVSAELATGWPKTGGIYIWVREAFGKPVSFVTIWLQWLYNVCWYPTILALVAATVAYIFNPKLANSTFYTLSVVMAVFWGATLLNCLGMKASSHLINATAVMGTIVPMIFVAILGIVWVALGHKIEFNTNWNSLLPDLSQLNNLVLLTAMLYGLVGMELAAMHAQDAKNPKKDYPKVMLIAGIIVLSTLILGSLAVAAVVPHKDLTLVDGLLKAFALFFKAFHMQWVMPIIAFLMAAGAIGGVSAWIIGPTKGLKVAAEDGSLPTFFAQTNRFGAPFVLLIAQGVIFTILCSVYLLMPSINSAFWVLTDMTSQVALLVYIAMFAAAIYLRYKYPNVERTFTIPGGKVGVWVTGLLGIGSCLFAIAIGFLPPSQFKTGSLLTYESILIVGMLFAILVPLAICWANYIANKRTNLERWSHYEQIN